VTAPASWTVLAPGLAFPEGPAFAPDGALWCVELKGGALVRMTLQGAERIAVGGEPNGLAFDAAGRAWFCDAGANAIRRFDPASGATETIVSDPRLDRPNDLAFGPAGELVFTCPGNSRQAPTGKVWRWSAGAGLSLVAEELYFPNGLAFGDGGRTLVVAETYRQRIWQGGWCDDAWTDRRILAEVGGPVGPDGLAFDSGGVLHAAVYGQRRIRRIAPSGALLEDWPTPGANPTNCAFDPAGRLGLVVTEADRGELLSLPTPTAGASLFAPASAHETSR
jgi:gluconolactonase